MALSCSAPRDGAVVHFSGEVYPCTMLCRDGCHSSLQLGDLNETGSLSAIMKGKKASRLRERLSSGDIEGLCCAHCDRAKTCNLYGDPTGGNTNRGLNWKESEQAPPEWTLQRLELGLTDLCNMRCEMCALTRGEASPMGGPVRGFMALEQVEACIPSLQESLEAGEEVTVWLHWVGEPLIHPEVKTILRRLTSLGDRLHLFLVTNGLALDRDTTELLLSLPGQHSLSISLNAISESVFQEVNGSSERDRVYKNAHYFLEQRKSAGAEEEWSVLVTSVVLAKNLAELPSFVEYWRREFEQLGYAPSVVANGGFAQTAEQIHLLREIDLPESSSLFREALRQIGHKDPEWDLEATRELDVWFLEAHKALNWIGNPDDWPEIDWQTQLATWARGRASLHSGDLLGARKDLGSLARNPPPSDFPTYLALHHSLTGLSLAEGDLEQAKEYAQIALQADPADPYSQQLQQFADLLAHLMNQGDTGPTQGPLNFEFSPLVLMFVKKAIERAYQEGNPDNALQLGLRLLGVTPGEFIAQVSEFGFYFHRHQDYRRSIQFSDAVLERDPDCAHAHWLKAEGLSKMNRARLLAHLMNQGDTGPTQGPLNFEFSPPVLMFVKKAMQCAYQEGNPDNALQVGLRLLGVAPGEFIAQVSEVGFCFHRHKDYRRSIQFSDAVLERDPDCAYAHWLKAAGLSKMNRASQALPLLKKCLKRIDSGGPKGFEDAVHDTLAEVYLALDEPEQSRLHASKALAIRPERAETRTPLPPSS